MAFLRLNSYSYHTLPQVCLLGVSVHGWKWEVMETSGDGSMPVPGKPTPKEPHAPWANRGADADAGCRIGHCFSRMRNFMVLTGGIRDRGALQNDAYVLDLISCEWTKPRVRLGPSVQIVKRVQDAVVGR